jgi:hypothetical protein
MGVHARLQLVQIADFSLWLDKRGLTIINIQPATIDSFIEDRRRRVKPRRAFHIAALPETGKTRGMHRPSHSGLGTNHLQPPTFT